MGGIRDKDWGMPQRPKTGRGRIKRPQPTLYIGEWIRALGMRQNEVARGAQMNEGYLSELISGKSTKFPSIGLLDDIAGAMGIESEALKRPPPSRDVIEQVKDLDPAIINRLKTQ